jgi:hypothetical protein
LSSAGSVVTITGTFATVLGNLNNNGTFGAGVSLTDMGKQVVIGNAGNSRLVTLRLVQGPGNVNGSGLNGIVGYVCVENNTEVVDEFAVTVARV